MAYFIVLCIQVSETVASVRANDLKMTREVRVIIGTYEDRYTSIHRKAALTQLTSHILRYPGIREVNNRLYVHIPRHSVANTGENPFTSQFDTRDRRL